MKTSAIVKALTQGIEEIYVKILDEIYKESTATKKLHKVTDKTPTQKRVRKPDFISPKLFTAILEEVSLKKT